MKVSTADAELFFKLMWSLQFYVNQKLQVLPDLDSLEDYQLYPLEERFLLRNTLWENPNLIGTYVAENPQQFPEEELAIVQKWERHIAGTFQIFRHLKKHSIFIGENNQVYGVLGLHDSLEDALYGRTLPLMVNTVLLPFKGQIVYDGILNSYNVYFGSGIRSELNDIYMTAKQNKRIITTLEPELSPPTPISKEPIKDWGPVVDEVVNATNSLKGGPVIQNAAFRLLRASAALAQSAVNEPDNLDELWKLEKLVRTALTHLQTVLNRAER